MKNFRSLYFCLALVALLYSSNKQHQIACQEFEDQSANGNTACSIDSDCPTIYCLVAPCPQSICVDGLCQMEPNPPNPECTQDSDCAAVSKAPLVCENGLCITPPPADDNAVVDEQEEDQDLSCGPTTCKPGQTCCNKSCGYCIEPGGHCTEEYCLPPEDENEVGSNNNNFPEEETTTPDASVTTTTTTPDDDLNNNVDQDGWFVPCNTTSDCPVIQCLVAPCDEYTCNTTLGECVVVAPPAEDDETFDGEAVYVSETILEESATTTTDGEKTNATSSASGGGENKESFISSQSITHEHDLGIAVSLLGLLLSMVFL